MTCTRCCGGALSSDNALTVLFPEAAIASSRSRPCQCSSAAARSAPAGRSRSTGHDRTRRRNRPPSHPRAAPRLVRRRSPAYLAPDQGCRPLLDVATDDVEHQIDAADVLSVPSTTISVLNCFVICTAAVCACSYKSIDTAPMGCVQQASTYPASFSCALSPPKSAISTSPLTFSTRQVPQIPC